MKIRQYIRVPVECSVTFSGKALVGDGLVIDLSMGGMGGLTIHSTHPVEVGMTFSLEVFLPKENTPLKIKQATVQWVQDGKFAVKIEAMDESEEQRLQQFVVAHLNKTSMRMDPGEGAP